MRAFAREKYRVVQWATGNQGRFSLDMLTNGSHPHLELVGCWVHSPSKVGVDAGVAAGLDRDTGVLTTDDVDLLIALQPDAVIYTGFWSDAELFCRLLASGINVVTQVGAVYMRVGGRRRLRIEKACAAGGTTFFAGGINTGFFSDRLAASLTSLNGEVSHIEVVEYSPGSLTGLSEYMIFDAMGFGWSQADLDREKPKLYTSLNDSAMFAGGDFLGAALGFEVDQRQLQHEFVMADRDYLFAGRKIAKGTVAGVRTTYAMSVHGVERVRYSQAWTIDGAVKTDWPYAARPKAVYQIRITGTPSYSVFWEPDGDGMYDALYSTAATVVNAVPFVCDAPLGVRTQIDLPMLSFSGALR